MRELTKKQRRALEDYATLTITLERLQECLGDAIKVSFRPDERKVVFHYDNQKPVVHIELPHIRGAIERHGRGEITTAQLSDWAAMLLANPSYDWEGPEEDEISGWLNEISLLSLKLKAE